MNNVESAKRLYEQSMVLDSSGDTDGAISRLILALYQAPDFIPAYILLGRLYFIKGDLKRSVKIFQKALKIDPESPQALDGVKTITQIISEKQLADNTFTSEHFRFSVQCPEGWKISPRHVPEQVVTFVSHRKGEHINVVAGPTEGQYESIRDLENQALRTIHWNKFTYRSMRQIRVDNIQAVEIVYDGPLYLRSKKVGFVNNGIEYLITGGVKAEDFENSEHIIDTFVQSFRLVPESQSR